MIHLDGRSGKRERPTEGRRLLLRSASSLLLVVRDSAGLVECPEWLTGITYGSSTASLRGERQRRRSGGEDSRGLGSVVGALEVVPGANGIFDVHVDGTLVFTKSMIGRTRNRTTSRRLLRAELG